MGWFECSLISPSPMDRMTPHSQPNPGCHWSKNMRTWPDWVSPLQMPWRSIPANCGTIVEPETSKFSKINVMWLQKSWKNLRRQHYLWIKSILLTKAELPQQCVKQQANGLRIWFCGSTQNQQIGSHALVANGLWWAVVVTVYQNTCRIALKYHPLSPNKQSLQSVAPWWNVSW